MFRRESGSMYELLLRNISALEATRGCLEAVEGDAQGDFLDPRCRRRRSVGSEVLRQAPAGNEASSSTGSVRRFSGESASSDGR
jgi:hypothetical protein